MPVSRLMKGADLARALKLDAGTISKITIVATRDGVTVTTESHLDVGSVEPLLQRYTLLQDEPDCFGPRPDRPVVQEGR